MCILALLVEFVLLFGESEQVWILLDLPLGWLTFVFLVGRRVLRVRFVIVAVLDVDGDLLIRRSVRIFELIAACLRIKLALENLKLRVVVLQKVELVDRLLHHELVLVVSLRLRHGLLLLQLQRVYGPHSLKEEA